MNRRRDEMLKEMGLWPVWRLRGASLAPVPPLDTPPVTHGLRQSHLGSAVVVSAVGVSPGGGCDSFAAGPLAGANASAPIEKGERSLERPFPHHSARDRVRGGSPSGAPVPPLDTHPSRPTRHASPISDERRARIMQMDWGALKGCVAACVDCELHAKRTRTVFGVGDERASWLFVGEGPGADEDAQGEPFVGQAGKLLDSMLAAVKLRRGQDVYIANIVKCRPPGNRNPQPEEALACEPYLHRQIELIGPQLIVALGRVAAMNLLAREATIASLRGRVHQYRGTPLIVTYHPAYLLRNLPDKAKAWADLCFAVETMRGLKERAGATI